MPKVILALWVAAMVLVGISQKADYWVGVLYGANVTIWSFRVIRDRMEGR